MGKKILAVSGHPSEASLCAALHAAYVEGATAAGADVRSLELRTLSFNPVFNGYRDPRPLEDDLKAAQELIAWCEHLVVTYPVWWGAVPGLLKGFVDRTFLPGFAFRYSETSPLPERLLKGRSGRLIMTMDAPVWYYRLVHRRASEAMMRYATLEFSGIKPVRVTRFGNVRGSTAEKRTAWLNKAAATGRLDAAS